jgi:hypothetical protein
LDSAVTADQRASSVSIGMDERGGVTAISLSGVRTFLPICSGTQSGSGMDTSSKRKAS